MYIARAPGRLDVMGGIADYSGALVLQVGFFKPLNSMGITTITPSAHLHGITANCCTNQPYNNQ